MIVARVRGTGIWSSAPVFMLAFQGHAIPGRFRGRREGDFLLGGCYAVVRQLVHVDAPARWLGREEEALPLLLSEAAWHVRLGIL
jgi:hypothetical protein